MKKRITWMICICLLVLLTACGKKEEKNSGLTAIDKPGNSENSVSEGTTQTTPGVQADVAERGWDVTAILAEGYFSTDYQEYFVGGISFVLDADAKTATATSTYMADTTEYYMPDEFVYEGTTYKVTAAEDGVFTDSDATRIRLSKHLTVIPESMFWQ